jgi:hypothetical protein
MNFVFIIGVLFVFVLAVMITRSIFFDPTLLQNLQDGKTASTISASSIDTGDAVASNFAYSIWFYINDWNYRYGEPKVIFGRMGAPSAPGEGVISGVSGIDPCPAVVLGALENNLSVSVGCFPGADEEPTVPGGKTIVHTCVIANIPVQKWTNLAISVYGRTMDMYVNGKLVRTCMLPGIASANPNADIHVTPAGGFDGWTAKLQYFSSPINPQDAWNIYSHGYTNWASVFNGYNVKLSVVENGVVQNSMTF